MLKTVCRWNFTWMVDGESCLKQLIFENTHLEQCPLVAIFILPRPFWIYFMLITSKPLHGIQRNFTQVIDGEWCQQQSISPGLQWHPLLAIFIRFLLFFLLIFKTVWPKLTELHIIDREKTQHQPVFEPAGPPQRPLVDIFILDFDFFVLIFKTVWRISMKLHTNDRQRESPYCSWFSKTLAHSSTTWRPFLFFVGHFEICLC